VSVTNLEYFSKSRGFGRLSRVQPPDGNVCGELPAKTLPNNGHVSNIILSSYSASVYDKRVKATGIFNTGVIDPGRRWYLGEMKQPVGLFYGGQQDFAAKYVS
jgi:hypothetical protein